jgi:putative SOS response-associated peptidase YedK
MSTYILTKAQRAALKRVFDRQPLVLKWNGSHATADRWANYSPEHPQMTYRQFRNLVVHSFDCVMVPWCGMWLGIEQDGYTHS